MDVLIIVVVGLIAHLSGYLIGRERGIGIGLKEAREFRRKYDDLAEARRKA